MRQFAILHTSGRSPPAASQGPQAVPAAQGRTYKPCPTWIASSLSPVCMSVCVRAHACMHAHILLLTCTNHTQHVLHNGTNEC